ncbi:hypothetical protein [Actinophytocola sp. KF-1]
MFNFVASALALSATVFGLAGQVHSGERQAVTADADVQTVYADLNGDGRMDRVTLRTVDGNMDEQVLTARVGGKRLTATVSSSLIAGTQPMRVVDVDADGRDEVVVTEMVGANTDHYGVWGLHGTALTPVKLADGTPLRLMEGGGLAAIVRYGCVDDHDGRQLIQVSGQAVDLDYTRYEGEYVAYVVDGGVATEVARVPVSGPRDTPGFQADPALCH